MSKAATVYREAASLIEGGWIQGGYAKTANGLATSSCSEDAEAFCLVGALHHAVNREGMTLEEFREIFLQTDFPFITDNRQDMSLLMAWNDREERTQEEVVQALKNAAKQWDDNGTE